MHHRVKIRNWDISQMQYLSCHEHMVVHIPRTTAHRIVTPDNREKEKCGLQKENGKKSIIEILAVTGLKYHVNTEKNIYRDEYPQDHGIGLIQGKLIPCSWRSCRNDYCREKQCQTNNNEGNLFPD